MPSYNPRAIEPKWQQYWLENKTFRTPDRSDKPKFYILDMFPYPSGAGLHVGHPEGYTATDILARYQRMQRLQRPAPDGLGRLRPAGRAVRHQDRHAPARSPRSRTSTPSAGRSRSLGFSYDWDREVDTTDPDYFKWTQWIFLQICSTPGTTPTQNKGRPISELPIPAEVQAQGDGGGPQLSGRAAAGVPGRGAGELVPGAGHGAGQRGGHRRQERARRPSRSSAHAAAAVAAAHHRVRRAAAGRPGAARLAGVDQEDAARTGSARARARRSISTRRPTEPQAAGAWIQHASASSRRGPTRCSARRTWCWRPSIRWSSGSRRRSSRRRSRRTSDAGRPQERPRAHRAGQEEDRRLHRRVRDQPGQRRADPDLDRRLRADELRHRRDHGRARRTTSATSSSPRSSTCRSSPSSIPATSG